MSRTLRKLVKWFYLLIAMTLILLAVLVQSGRSFSHLLGDYNQSIADYLSSKLNADVSIGGIEAGWSGLKPNLVVQDLIIKSQDDLPIVALEQARLRLDILGSLRNLRPVWSSLVLQQVDVTFAQTAEGFWQIPGLPPLRKSAPGEGVQLDSLLDMLLLSTRIEFKRSHLNFEFSSGQRMVLDSPSLLLENLKDFHRLSLQIDVDEQPRSVYLVMEAKGDPRDQQSFHSKGYLQLNRFPTSEPIAAASAFLLGGKSGLQAEGQVDASIWFETRQQDDGYDLVGSLGVQRLSLPLGERRLGLDDFATELTGYWLPGGQWRLGLQQLNAAIGKEQIAGLNLAATSTGYRQPISLTLDSLDLKSITHMLETAGVLGKERLYDVLHTLKPRGHLRNLKLTLPMQNPAEWQIRANLDQVTVDALQGVPALVGVDGYVQAGQTGGFVDIDSRKGFSMHYSPTFDKPMEYDSARGQVAWHLQPEKNQIYVNSGLLEFRKGDEVARGYMWLGLPWKRNTGDIDLYLHVGGQGVNTGLYSKYTPATLPDTLADWLARSIGVDNPGVAREVGFIYRGTLNTKNPMARSYQLYLDLEKASLDYHVGWPAIRDLNGRILITDAQIGASVASARLLDSSIENAQVRVTPGKPGHGSLLEIDGNIQGPAGDGIRVLREGEMRKFMGAALDSWEMQGSMQGRLELDIPLGGAGDKLGGHRQIIDVNLQAPRFELQNLNLSATDVSGRIRYDSESGISSRDLRGKVFDEPIEVELSTQKLDSYSKTLISLGGAVDARQLAFWSKRPEVLFMKGKLPYQAMVELNHRPRPTDGATAIDDTATQVSDSSNQTAAEFSGQALATISVTSDLQGVAVDLPAPYGKLAADARPMVFQYWLQEARSQIQFAYGSDVQGVLRMNREQGHLLAANIALGSEAQLPDGARFLVSGYVPEVELEQLKDVQTRYEAYTQELTPVVVRPLNAPRTPHEVEELLAAEAEAVGRVAGLPFRAELVIGNYELGSVAFQDLNLVAVPVRPGWDLAINNAQVEGKLMVPSSKQVPLDVDLQRLSLVTELGEEEAVATELTESGEPLEPVPAEKELLDPYKMPLANINIRSLFLNGDNFGNWSMHLRPNEKGVLIDQIRGSIRGVTVQGAEQGSGAKMHWQYTPAGMQTRFIGMLSAGDMGAVLREWQKPDTLESQSARFTADLFWSGSPQDFKIVELGGEMALHLENGRFKREANAGDGILRLLSILNFDSLARRMRLDFSDLYKSGLAYDHIEGKVRFNQGTLVFADPLLVRTPSSGLQMAGTINLRDETINTRLVATLPVASNLTFFAALATGLPAAAGIYLVSKLFKKQVDQATSISYRITGDWDKPQMRFDRFFESEQSLRDSVEKKEEKPPP